MIVSNKKTQKSAIWDVYIRIFHWSLTILVLTSYISIKFFDNLDLHFFSGYCIVGLLVFRLSWGLFGSETARFVNFVKGPTAIVKYLISFGKNKPSFGHSPIAAVSVIAMLLILIFQVVSGLFFYDEEIFLEGPLAQYGSNFMLDNAYLYHPIGANLVLFIIATHVIAIAIYYIFLKDNLITPMITGLKNFQFDKVLNVKHIVAIICIVIASGVVGSILYFGN